MARIHVHNVAKTLARLEKAFWEQAMPVVAEQELTDCNFYVRMQSGNLADSAKHEKGYREIHWRTAYAKRVYYTGTPRKNRNPNASLRWCEVAKRKYSHQWADIATRILGGG